LNGSGVFIGLDLSVVRPPETDHPAVFASRGEDDHIDQGLDVADGDIARLPIVGTGVLAVSQSKSSTMENGRPRSRRFYSLFAGSNSMAI
jgi:hypothetical protein